LKYKIITGLILIVFSSIGFTQKEQPYPPLYLVSAPTAGTLPKGTFTSEFLLQKNGGILPKIEIGLTNHFMIGLSYGMHKFIGDEKMNVNKTYPEVQIKYRAYEETTQWPAVVVGLDTQGRGEYHEYSIEEDSESELVERYDRKAWGAFVVASKNWNALGNLGFHIGIAKNLTEGKDGDKDIDFFFGFDKELNRSFSLLLEYDAAFNDNDNNLEDISFGKGNGYLNAGVRWAVTPNLMLELDYNNITKNVEDADYANRELKIIYSETF
jgi:hypothetical protein